MANLLRALQLVTSENTKINKFVGRRNTVQKKFSGPKILFLYSNKIYSGLISELNSSQNPKLWLTPDGHKTNRTNNRPYLKPKRFFVDEKVHAHTLNINRDVIHYILRIEMIFWVTLMAYV